jgi:hypothetical protein
MTIFSKLTKSIFAVGCLFSVASANATLMTSDVGYTGLSLIYAHSRMAPIISHLVL